MRKTDRLSKRLDQKIGIENNNKNKKKLIMKEQIYSLVEVVVKGLEVDILENIKKTKEKDEEIVRVVEKIKRADIKMLRGNE